MLNFETALKRVLRHEGGYVDHPHDPGGATNQGITLGTFRRFCGRSKTKEDLKAIGKVTVRQIYHDKYWAACRCDALPAGVDYTVFDFAVNSGPYRAIVHLQGAVGTVKDGILGPKTLRAVRRTNTLSLINAVRDSRLAFLKRIRNGQAWKIFGKGWSRRVESVRTYAHTLATAAGEHHDSP